MEDSQKPLPFQILVYMHQVPNELPTLKTFLKVHRLVSFDSPDAPITFGVSVCHWYCWYGCFMPDGSQHVGREPP